MSSTKDQFLTMTVGYSPGGVGYGFDIDGRHKPLRVASVTADSPAYRSGLKPGDRLLRVNGHDVSQAALTTIQAIINYATGSPLTMKISRSMWQDEGAGQRVADAGKTKVSSTAGGRQAYQSLLGDAVRSAQDAFDLLGLSPKSSPSERAEVEIAVNLEGSRGAHNDSDQSSPPPSSPDHSDIEELDPLLDFTKGADSFSHESQGHLSAAMVGGAIRTQQALQEIKKISESMTPRKLSKDQKPVVSSEASIVIGGRNLPTKPSNESEILSPPSVTSHVSDQSSSNESQSRSVSSTSSSSIPPPVPPYKPLTPDQFPLSNRREYHMHMKRKMHTYEDVEFETPVPRQEDSAVNPDPVVFRKKGVPKSKETTATAVTEPSPKQRSFAPSVSTAPLDPIKASIGLPASVHTWKQNHVAKWLEQLSPSLSEQYKQCFSFHCVTGHTILHLDQNKLQYMGITNKEHRMQLAMAIARLRLSHEKKELEHLSGQVSWL